MQENLGSNEKGILSDSSSLFKDIDRSLLDSGVDTSRLKEPGSAADLSKNRESGAA